MALFSKKEKKPMEPQYLASPLNNMMLNYKVYYMKKIEKIMYFLCVFCAGGFVGEIFYGNLFKVDGEATMATYISNVVVFVVVGLIACKIFVPVIQNNLKVKRDNKLRRQFMDFLDSLSSSLSAGSTVNNAFLYAQNDLQNQYSERDFIIIELAEIILGLQNGKTLEEMIMAFGERSDSEDIKNFSNVISNCYRLGGNFKDVVRRTRDLISDKIAIEEEINTKLASNKMQHNAMSVMPIFLVALLKLSSASFADNLTSLLGVVATTIAVGLFVASYFWGQKIIKIG